MTILYYVRHDKGVYVNEFNSILFTPVTSLTIMTTKNKPQNFNLDVIYFTLIKFNSFLRLNVTRRWLN